MLTKTFTITVGPDEIKHGKPRDCNRCAVALSIAKATGLDPRRFQVGPDVVVFFTSPDALDDTFVDETTLPPEAQAFIDNIDRDPSNPSRTPPQPFAFPLDVPVEVLPC